MSETVERLEFAYDAIRAEAEQRERGIRDPRFDVQMSVLLDLADELDPSGLEHSEGQPLAAVVAAHLSAGGLVVLR